MNATTTSWRVEPSDAGRRLDVAVVSHFEDVSRARVRRWIDEGRVRVEGAPAKASRLCREGEIVEVSVPAPRPAEPEPEDIPLAILYQDEHLIVIDKPAGMVVHPSPGHEAGTLVNALLFHCKDLSGIGGVERPGIVHRLDAGTTGVLVVAKHDRAHQRLASAFEERRVDKRYLAVVHGAAPEHLVIERAIGRDPRQRTKMSTRSLRGKPATSTVERIEALPESSLLSVRIHTGRTHQIRVHLSEAGHPVVGDRDYGAPGVKAKRPRSAGPAFFVLRDFERPALHASRLALHHPETGELMEWHAPLPRDMDELLTKLRALG